MFFWNRFLFVAKASLKIMCLLPWPTMCWYSMSLLFVCPPHLFEAKFSVEPGAHHFYHIDILHFLKSPALWFHHCIGFYMGIGNCLRVSIAAMKHQKSSPRGKGLFSLYFQIIVSSSLEVVKTGVQAGLRGRIWYRGHWSRLTGLLHMTCKPCFLIEPRITSPGIAPPTMGWVHSHQ